VKAAALAASGARLAEVNDAYAAAVDALRPFGRELVARAHRSHFAALMGRGKTTEASAAAEAAFAALKPIVG
jgi:hypothetical protein